MSQSFSDHDTAAIRKYFNTYPGIDTVPGAKRHLFEILLNYNTINYRLTNDRGDTPLTYACTLLHGLPIVTILLERYKPQDDQDNPIKKIGIDINATNNHGNTALINACIYDRVSIVELLLKQPDIKVNVKCNDTFDGNTALMYACGNENVEIIRLLLNHSRIDVNQGNQFNNTPLMFACNHNHLEIVTLLMEKPDIDVNIQDVDGITALMENVAAQVEHVDHIDDCVSILSLLLSNEDIDILIKNSEGINALDLAVLIQANEPPHPMRQNIINLLATKIQPVDKHYLKKHTKIGAGNVFKKGRKSKKRRRRTRNKITQINSRKKK